MGGRTWRWGLVGVISVVVIVAGVVTVRVRGGRGTAADILALDVRTGRVLWTAHPNAVFLGQGSIGSGRLSVYTERFGHGCDELASTVTFDAATGHQTSERHAAPGGISNEGGVSAREGSTEFKAYFPPDTDGPPQPGSLGAVDLTTGKELWRVPLPAGWVFSSRLAVGDGVIVGLVRGAVMTEEEEFSGSGYVEGIDATTGREIWKAATPELTSEFTFGDGQLYVSRSHSIVVFEARTGERRWDVRVPFEGVTNTPQGMVLSLAAGEGLVVAAGRGRLQAYDITGKKKWAVSLPGDRNYSMLGVGNGRAYAGADGRSPKMGCLGD